MGKWEETQEAYYSRENPAEEQVIPEENRMGLVQALTILHSLRDGFSGCKEMGEVCEAFGVIFEWIDNAVILFAEFGEH